MSKSSTSLLSKRNVNSLNDKNEEVHNNERSTSKSLVRNCEVIHPNVSHNDEVPSTSQIKTDKKQLDDINLSEPKPYSCIKISDYMKIINDMGCRKVKIPPEKVKPPKAKGLKKINIPMDEQVYKGLIDLDVREEDLGINIAQIKPKEFIKQRDVEPVLSDYYKPKFNHEYVIKTYPPEFELSKVWTFKGDTVLRAMNKWETKQKL